MFDEPAFRAKMSTVETRYEELSSLLGQPDVIAKRNEFARLSKEHADLTDLVTSWRSYKKVREDMDQARAMMSEGDSEMRELAKAEIDELTGRAQSMEQAIKLLLL